MGFDVLYLPPIHPIGITHRKGPQQRADGRARTIPAARGRSAPRRAATRPSIPSSARSTTSTAWSRAAREHGLEVALDIAFQCSPDHPWVTRAPASGSATGPTARSSTPRTRRRSTRTSTRSTSRREDWRGAVGRLLETSCCFWIEHGRAHLPRRQPAHQAVRVLGVADRRGQARASRTSIFLAEAFTRPEGHVPPGEARLHPVVHLLHLAQHASGS